MAATISIEIHDIIVIVCPENWYPMERRRGLMIIELLAAELSRYFSMSFIPLLVLSFIFFSFGLSGMMILGY